jgi:hypothetical protein
VLQNVLASLLAALAAVAVAWYGWTSETTARVDVGAATDGAAVEHFFEREQGQIGNYRWGRDQPVVRVPVVRGPALLMLRMAGRPAGLDVRVQLLGQAPSAFSVKGGELRRYTLLWGGVAAGDTAQVTIDAQAERVPPEKRALSVLVESLGLEPLRVTSAPLPIAIAALFALVGLAAYLALRGVGLPPALALLVGIPAVGALALAWSWQRALVAPYLWPLVAAVAAVAILLTLLRWRAGAQVSDLELLLCLLASGGAAALFAMWETLAGRELPWMLVALTPLVAALAALLVRGRPRALAAVLALAGWAALFWLQLSSILADPLDLRSDFHALLRGAARVYYGTLPLYNLTTIGTNPLASTYTAPPLVALLLQPLAGWPLADALAAWRFLSLALLALAALLVVRAYRASPRSWLALGVLMLCMMTPAVSGLADGELSIVLLALAALAVWAMLREHALIWGAALGAMAALNPAMLVLLPFAALQRRWRALAAGLAAFVLLALAGLLALGMRTQLVYVLGVLPRLAISTSWVENQSLFALVSRLYEVDRLAPQPAVAGNVARLSGAVALGVALLTAILARRSALRVDLAFGLWLTGMLLVLPVSWLHYQVLLVIPLAQGLVLARERAGGLSWPAAALYALAWMLIGQGDRWLFYDGTLLGAFWQLVLSYKCYGMLLLFAAIVLATRPERGLVPAADSPPPGAARAALPPTQHAS